MIHNNSHQFVMKLIQFEQYRDKMCLTSENENSIKTKTKMFHMYIR